VISVEMAVVHARARPTIAVPVNVVVNVAEFLEFDDQNSKEPAIGIVRKLISRPGGEGADGLS